MTHNHEHGSGFEDVINQMGDGRLYAQRAIFISEAIDSSVAKRVVSQLLSLESEKPGAAITIYLNSPGGEVTSGYAIYDTMRFITSEVRVVSLGLTASIATVIFCGAKKSHRYSLPNAKFLIHQPLIPGQIRGQATDLEITARDILKTRDRINELLSKECGQPLDRVEKDTSRDYWMTATEALEYGLVTKIIENIKDIR